MSSYSGESSVKNYTVGFIASLILTAIPFAVVAFEPLSKGMTYVVIFACAIVQILVHFIYFLHMESKTEEGRWNVMSLVFVAVVILILVVGSIWIMWNLNINMMM